MKSKLEVLCECSNCKERASTPDGFEYCKGDIADCPYRDIDRFVTIPDGSYHPCNYFATFDKIIGLRTNDFEEKPAEEGKK